MPPTVTRGLIHHWDATQQGNGDVIVDAVGGKNLTSGTPGASTWQASPPLLIPSSAPGSFTCASEVVTGFPIPPSGSLLYVAKNDNFFTDAAFCSLFDIVGAAQIEVLLESSGVGPTYAESIGAAINADDGRSINLNAYVAAVAAGSYFAIAATWTENGYGNVYFNGALIARFPMVDNAPPWLNGTSGAVAGAFVNSTDGLGGVGTMLLYNVELSPIEIATLQTWYQTLYPSLPSAAPFLGPKTAAYAQELLNAFTNGVAPSLPSPCYVALFTSSPGNAGSAAGEIVSGRGYARVAAGFTLGESISNTGLISFGPDSTADWGTVTHFALCKSGTRGTTDLMYFGALNAPIAITVGQSLQFAPGALTLSEY
jgi:hypothetical protein